MSFVLSIHANQPNAQRLLRIGLLPRTCEAAPPGGTLQSVLIEGNGSVDKLVDQESEGRAIDCHFTPNSGFDSLLAASVYRSSYRGNVKTVTFTF